MSENINDDLQKFEELEALISVEEKGDDAEEKGAHEDEKGAPSIFMTDIRFKEAVEVGELLDEEAFAALDPEDQKGYEMVNVIDEDTKAPMAWMFRFKADEESEAEEPEEESAVEEMEEEVAEKSVDPEEAISEDTDAKAASIMMQMVEDAKKEVPSLFLTDIRFKEMEEDEDLIAEEKYADLDPDAKDSYEEVDVYEEGTGKGYGKRYRRRSPLEVNAMRKGSDEEEKTEDSEDAEVEEKAEDDMADMFDTAEAALERAAALGCEGTHGAGEKFMPCATHEEYLSLTADKPEAAEKSDDFLCGFQRKSVEQPCDFCQGGCAPEDGLPGLFDIESAVKDAHPGEILGSGYSSTDDMFVVDVKRDDGTCIEVFLSGDGDELGWLRVDETLVEGKSAEELAIISSSEAETVAVKAFEELELEAKGEVMGIMVDIFADEDVYVVEVDADQKSYDFFISVEGKVLGYDEYDVAEVPGHEMSEEDEIKALEAELEIKRMYSREQREAMAESGEAMEDGSFPIADEADLKNAIQAHGRATDVDAAKVHIIKRAKELGLEEMIPEDWETPEAAPAEAAPADAAATPEGEKSEDAEMLSLLYEFRALMEDGLQ